MEDNVTEACKTECKLPEDKVYKWQLESLQNDVKRLQKAVNVLTILCDTFAKHSGIKIERYVDGVTVISRIGE